MTADTREYSQIIIHTATCSHCGSSYIDHADLEGDGTYVRVTHEALVELAFDDLSRICPVPSEWSKGKTVKLFQWHCEILDYPHESGYWTLKVVEEQAVEGA